MSKDRHAGRCGQRLRRAPLRVLLTLLGSAAAGCVLALLVAACGDPSGSGVASVGSGTPTPASSATGSAKGSVLAYSQCMRQHGIKSFPDPDASGDLALAMSKGSEMDPENPQYKAADQACKSLLPPANTHPQVSRAQTLKYAQCMRDQGIADFPDPKADGSLQVQTAPGSDLDPTNPAFKDASEACKQYLPGGGKGGGSLSTQDEGGKE
jgi:hypothetical protein